MEQNKNTNTNKQNQSDSDSDCSHDLYLDCNHKTNHQTPAMIKGETNGNVWN